MLSTPLASIEFNAEEFDEFINEIQTKPTFLPISVDGKGGGSRQRKNVARKVETCTRCDFIVAMFYNGTHDIQAPVVLPYYKERQSEYLLDCARCKTSLKWLTVAMPLLESY